MADKWADTRFANLLEMPDSWMPKRVRIDWRRKGGRKPEGTVVVARPSRFGNPYRVGEDARDNAQAVKLFRDWIEGDSIGARLTRGEAMAKLKGKDLACYCGLDQPCHADVLLEIANLGYVRKGD